MSDQIVNVTITNTPTVVNATVQLTPLQINASATIIGQQGPAGSNYTEIPLLVTTPAQILFNIFTQPTGLHYLLVNGVEYYNISSYTITPGRGNIYLNWLNEFLLSTTDILIFRKF